jgi:tetratricopeptide (TPR) repeat protein
MMPETSDAERQAAIAAEITADVTATPLPRAKLDLLWIGPALLTVLGSFADLPEGIAPTVVGLDDDMHRIVENTVREIEALRITPADIAWAVGVDGIAGEAERKANDDDLLGAIGEFRRALRQAPGCDNYMMSMATCYANLGLAPEALRYLERARQINPGNARIARNLAELRAAMSLPVAVPGTRTS